jgi:hypothetical protein
MFVFSLVDTIENKQADLGDHRRKNLPLAGAIQVKAPPPPDVGKFGGKTAKAVARNEGIVAAWSGKLTITSILPSAASLLTCEPQQPSMNPRWTKIAAMVSETVNPIAWAQTSSLTREFTPGVAAAVVLARCPPSVVLVGVDVKSSLASSESRWELVLRSYQTFRGLPLT